MAELTLNPRPALGRFLKDYGSVVLEEMTSKALVSIAFGTGNEKKLTGELQKQFQVTLPKVGSSTISKSGSSVFLGMQRDQILMLFDHEGDNAVRFVADKLADAGYYSDQSDSWVMMKLSGAGTRTALERICMIDLHPKAFPAGSVARTTMEHLGTIIYFQGDDSFIVMAARSSAKSLLHALEISIQNTV